MRPKVVCICGSTRFAASMNIEAERLTLAGMIVVRPEVIAYNRERDQQFVEPEVKARLDVLHLRKIDLADEVVVVTEDHYIGESTAREIAYARANGKAVAFVEYGGGDRG
jgi:DNA-binding GntR family transcriptional regulator